MQETVRMLVNSKIALRLRNPIHMKNGGSGLVSSERYGFGLCSVWAYFLIACQSVKFIERKGDVPVTLK